MFPPTPQPDAPDAPIVSPAAPAPLQWAEADEKAWKLRIEDAISSHQGRRKDWFNKAIANYAPQVKENPDKYSLEVRTNRAYATVERKNADLFYKKPEVTVTATPLLASIPQGDIAATAQAEIVNSKLGADDIDGEGLASRCIFDYQLFGAGWSKLGYRTYTTDVTDPATGQVVPVPVKSECFWEPLSPLQVLVPKNARTTDVDKWPWVGWRGEMSLNEARRVYGDKIPPDFSPASPKEPLYFDHGVGDVTPSKETVTFSEIYFKSSVYRADVAHPDRQTKLVLIDGITEPVFYADHPDQTVDARGRLTPDSLIGYQVTALIIRVLTDSNAVMSDVAIGLPLTKELDEFRKQQVETRDINQLKLAVNADAVPLDAVNKITFAANGLIVMLPKEFFQGVNAKWLDHGAYPPDNFQFENRISSDHDRLFASDPTSQGAFDPSQQTATEASLRQANVNVLLSKQQNSVAKWYLRGVRKLSTLMQRYLTLDDAAEIVGQAKATIWDSVRHQIPTRLAFEMVPDSSLRDDTPLERKQWQDLFTFLANDPHLNRPYFLKRLLQKFHADPTQALLPPDKVPQPKPEPPKASVAIKLEDLANPLIMSNPTVLAVLAAVGVDVTQLAPPAPTQPPHGGKLAPIPSLDKHATDQTFGTQNSGALSPQGPTTLVQ